MKSCIVSLIEYQGTLPCLYPSKAEAQRESPASKGVRWPQFSSAKRLEDNCNTAGRCPWELWWGFNTEAMFQKKLSAGWIFCSRPFISWLLRISSSQTAQASQRIGCFLSAHVPSPGSADSCIRPSGSDLLGHDAAGSLLLPGATSFPGKVSEPGKGWPWDSQGPYSHPLCFEKEAAGGACIFLAVPPNGLPRTLAEAQQSLSLDFPILL